MVPPLHGQRHQAAARYYVPMYSQHGIPNSHQKGSVILQLNGSLDQAKADEYGKVIAALP